MSKDEDGIIFLEHYAFESIICENEELCREFLSSSIGRKIKGIKYLNKEQVLKDSKKGKGAALDIFCEDEDGDVFDSELQVLVNIKEFPYRVRFYQSYLDRKLLKRGKKKFSLMKDNYIVFLTPHDPYKKGKALYTIKESIPGVDENIENGRHVYLYNTDFTDGEGCNKEMLDLLSWLKSGNIKETPSFSLGKSIKRDVKKFMESEDKMQALYTVRDWGDELKEQGRVLGLNEGMQKGIDVGRSEGILSTAKAMLNEGMSTSLISKITGLSISDIEKLK